MSTAVRAWHDAYSAALASRGWQGMVAAGDALVRIGQVSRSPGVARPKARQAYMVALVRARRQASVDGALRVSEAFAALDDREVVQQCLRIAERLATEQDDGAARERVRAMWERLADRVIGWAP